MGSDCGCALLALRMLARVEEFTSTFKVPLEVALQLTEEAESHGLAVLSCEACCQQRLPLTTITVLSARLVDWLCRLWRLGDDDDDSHESHQPDEDTTASTVLARHAPQQGQSRTFYLGGYSLDPDEADALSHELMTLRLTRFSAVLGSLEAALLSSSSAPCLSASPGSTFTSAGAATVAPACLDLVRSNLRRLRACIRRLKARSLLSNANTGTTAAAVFDVPMPDRGSSAPLPW